MSSSPTQQALSPVDVARHLQSIVGVQPIACAPLSGGTFAVVWRIDLPEPVDGERTLVLKVGPRPEARVLRYEKGMVAAEADYLSRLHAGAPSVPVPRVVASGTARWGDGARFDGEWVLATFLPGTPLDRIEQMAGKAAADDVRHQVGAALAVVHRGRWDGFGYPGDRPRGSTWGEAMCAIVESVLADAEDWHVDLGDLARRTRAAFDRHGDVLDEVERASLLHWDLWDGNILAEQAEDGRHRLTGIVDGERFLLGDPLVDLVSPYLFRRIEDEPDHPLLVGYAEGAGAPLVFDGAVRRRLSLYRVWLYLVMVVEMPSRGMTEAGHRYRSDQQMRCLLDELDRLGV